MTVVKGFAPAKINLTLHVTGQRPDGYHLLDSLVVFGDVGDLITVSPSHELRLTVSGPMARGVPTDRRNLVLRAAGLMGVTADIHLEKHLPAAAGLGGGSSDAAATLRALSEMTGQPVPDLDDILTLGADVPLCMSGGLTRMRGIGEKLDRLGATQGLSMILINPGVSVPTGAVFNGLARKNLTPMQGQLPHADAAGWIAWLAAQRNDLQTPAIAQAPVIGRVLQALQQSQGCLLARMSGSGATCFAVMRDDGLRDAAVRGLTRDNPDWWIKPCHDIPAISAPEPS